MQNKKLATFRAINTKDCGAKNLAEYTPRAARGARDVSSSMLKVHQTSFAVQRRTTTLIELDRSSDVVAALTHACHSSLAPNRHITIDWEKAGVEDSILATGRFLKQMRDCFGRHQSLGSPTIAYIWVREIGPKVGEHVHILAHVPVGFSSIFAKRKPGWLNNCGAQRIYGASKTQVIRGADISGHSAMRNDELYRHNLNIIRNYLLKHCSRQVQRKFGIRGKGPVPIVGKRVSISQNLHRAARAKCELCE